MPPPNETFINAIMEMKEDVGSMKSTMQNINNMMESTKEDVDGIKSQISGMEGQMKQIPLIVANNRAFEAKMETRMSTFELDLKKINEESLPEIAKQLVIHQWFQSNRNKLLALVIVAIVGWIGGVASDFLKSKVHIELKPTEKAEAVAK